MASAAAFPISPSDRQEAAVGDISFELKDGITKSGKGLLDAIGHRWGSGLRPPSDHVVTAPIKSATVSVPFSIMLNISEIEPVAVTPISSSAFAVSRMAPGICELNWLRNSSS